MRLPATKEVGIALQHLLPLFIANCNFTYAHIENKLYNNGNLEVLLDPVVGEMNSHEYIIQFGQYYPMIEITSMVDTSIHSREQLNVNCIH